MVEINEQKTMYSSSAIVLLKTAKSLKIDRKILN